MRSWRLWSVPCPGSGQVCCGPVLVRRSCVVTEEECNILRGLPVTNVRDLGYYFEPDPATRVFKLYPLGAGYTNTHSGTSRPLTSPSEGPTHDFLPLEDEKNLRRLLRETLSWMADHLFVGRNMRRHTGLEILHRLRARHPE